MQARADEPPDEKSARQRPGFAEAAAPGAPRTVLARLFEDEQRIDGHTRWSVGESRHRCAECQTELPPDVPFDSVLSEAEPGAVATPANAPECRALFERRDFCSRCFAALPLERTFAHWKSVVPRGGEPPRKVFNLASLLAYFERLVGAERIDEEPAEGAEVATQAGDGEEFASGGGTPGRPREELSADEQAVRTEIAYLLGLFLVRKRVLRWAERSARELRLVLAKGEPMRTYRLEVPSERAVEDARVRFEELFT